MAKQADKSLPHVTDIINAVFPQRACDPWYLERGSAAHAWTAQRLMDACKHDDVDPCIDGRVRAALRYVSDFKLIPEQIELRVQSHKHQFCGTLDMLTTLDLIPLIVDWKGSVTKTAVLQLAAYAIAYQEETGKRIREGMAVETHDDETYTANRYKLTTAKTAFLHVLNVYRWMLKEGITNARTRDW